MPKVFLLLKRSNPSGSTVYFYLNCGSHCSCLKSMSFKEMFLLFALSCFLHCFVVLILNSFALIPFPFLSFHFISQKPDMWKKLLMVKKPLQIELCGLLPLGVCIVCFWMCCLLFLLFVMPMCATSVKFCYPLNHPSIFKHLNDCKECNPVCLPSTDKVHGLLLLDSS